MKTVFAYFILPVYLIAMCKPVLPVVKDRFAHIFWKAQHLATVHQHYGNYHVHSELKEMSDKSQQDQDTASSQVCEPVSVHILSQNNFSFLYQVSNALRNFPGRYYIQWPFVEIICPPPQGVNTSIYTHYAKPILQALHNI